jgi:hypothetical protein
LSGSRFTVGYFALSILFEIVDLPARALTSTCFFNYTLNIPNNLFFPYISGLAWQAGESTNGSPAMRDSSGLLVDIPACQMAGRFEFVGRYVLFRGY